MINPVSILDIIFVLAALAAIAALVRRSHHDLSVSTVILLFGLLNFLLLYGICLAVEWLGITTRLDKLEDYLGALLPMWWAFIFYAFLHEINFREIQALNNQLEQRFSSLKEAELRFRTIFDSASDGILIAQSGEKMFFAANEKICAMLGYTREELLTLGVSDVHPEDSLPCVIEQFKKLERKEIAIAKNIPVLKKDKSVFYADISAALMTIDDKDSLVGMFRDITERKNAEEKLFKSERKYFSTFNLIPNPMAVTELATGKIVDINQEFIHWTGYSREEAIGKSTLDLNLWVKTHDREKITHELTETGEANGIEILMKQKNGQIRNVLFSARFIDIDHERYLLTLAQDITELMQGKAMLRQSEEKYRLLADHTKDQVWLMDFDLNTTYISPSVEKVLGYKLEDLKELKLDDILSPESFKTAMNFFSVEMARAMGAEPTYVLNKLLELEFVCKDGHLIWGEILFSFIRDSQGKPLSILCEARDITERKQAEEKLNKTLDSLKKAVGTTIQVLVSALESRDPYTAGHQSRSADLACAIAREMRFDDDQIEGIRMAGAIHDIGKLSVPAEILTKPTKLTNLEFSLVKEHSQSGYEMLKHVDSPWPLAKIIQQHHERLDGSGYPNHLKNDEILMEARIMAVADVVEAMASHRPYRASLGIEAALEEIEKNKGVLFDDKVVDACMKLFREKDYKLE